MQTRPFRRVAHAGPGLTPALVLGMLAGWAQPGAAEGPQVSGSLSFSQELRAGQWERPELEAYVEVDGAGFYAGLAVRTVWSGSGPARPVDFDLSAGYRFELGDAWVDLGYVRYLDSRRGDCCGEVYALVDLDLGAARWSAGLSYDPSLRTLTDANIGLRYTLSDSWSAAATLGRGADGTARWRYVDLGVDYDLTDTVSLDAEYKLGRNRERSIQLGLSVALEF